MPKPKKTKMFGTISSFPDQQIAPLKSMKPKKVKALKQPAKSKIKKIKGI